MPSNHHETCSHPTRTLPHNTAPTSSNADEREPQGSEPRCHTSHQPDTNHRGPTPRSVAAPRKAEGTAGGTKDGAAHPGRQCFAHEPAYRSLGLLIRT